MNLTIRQSWRPRIRAFSRRTRAWRPASLPLYWRRRRTAWRDRVVSGPAHRVLERAAAHALVHAHTHFHDARRFLRQTVVIMSPPSAQRPASAPSISTSAERITAVPGVASIAPGLPRQSLAGEVRHRLVSSAITMAVRRLQTVVERRRWVAIGDAQDLASAPPVRPRAGAIVTRTAVVSARGGALVPATVPAARTVRTHAGPRTAAHRLDRRVSAPAEPSAAASARREPTPPAVPMDWRAPRVPPDAAVRAAAAPQASVADRGHAPAPSEQRHEATPHPGAAPFRERTVAPAIDASTIDRLTDTVMQRLDRRLRIERERRGL